MDDLEITRLCAMSIEAWKTAHLDHPTMTLDPFFSGVEVRGDRVYLVPHNPFRQDPQIYDPLHNRAQALELVERLDMRLHRETQCNGTVWNAAAPIHDGPFPEYAAGSSPSILRAICLCAARVQQAREAK